MAAQFMAGSKLGREQVIGNESRHKERQLLPPSFPFSSLPFPSLLFSSLCSALLCSPLNMFSSPGWPPMYNPPALASAVLGVIGLTHYDLSGILWSVYGTV